MKLFQRVIYMGAGALLMLALAVGGMAVFAQSGEETPADAGLALPAEAELPPLEAVAMRPVAGDGAGKELLAEALGISVEELEAACEEVRQAVIAQAVEDGLITERQAERLREGRGALRAWRAQHPGRAILRGRAFNQAYDIEARLAEALGISVGALQEARAEAQEARLAQLVEEGVLTQERADLIAARRAAAGYLDRDALAAAVQEAYEAAVDAALADGAISQEQAELLLENAPAFDGSRLRRGLRGPGFDLRFEGS